MKKLITALALAAFIASPAFAQTKTKKKTTVKSSSTSTPAVERTERNEPITTTASSSAYPTQNAYGNRPELSVGFGLGTAINKFHFGVGLKALFPVQIESNQFKFGGQTGFYFGPSNPTSWVLPILAAAEYDFKTSDSLKPYIGIAMGISIAHASYSTGFGTSTSASSTDFAFLFTPGVNFTSSNYFAELPIGVLNTEFALLPTVGMHF